MLLNVRLSDLMGDMNFCVENEYNAPENAKEQENAGEKKNQIEIAKLGSRKHTELLSCNDSQISYSSNKKMSKCKELFSNIVVSVDNCKIKFIVVHLSEGDILITKCHNAKHFNPRVLRLGVLKYGELISPTTLPDKSGGVGNTSLEKIQPATQNVISSLVYSLEGELLTVRIENSFSLDKNSLCLSIYALRLLLLQEKYEAG